MASIFSFPALRPYSRLSSLVFLAGLLLLVVGCHQEIKDPHDPRFIVAEGKGWTITRGELDAAIANFFKQVHKTVSDVPPAQMPLLEAGKLKSMVLEKLILQRADALHINVDQEDAKNYSDLRAHFHSDTDYQDQLKQAGMTDSELHKQIHTHDLVVKTLFTDAFKNADPTDAEINDFYLKNKAQMGTPEKIRASRVVILVDSKATPAEKAAKKKEIDKAHARIAKGEDFGKVAAEVSEDQYSKTKGGDVGYFQQGENEPAFDQVAFATKPGQVSPVFTTQTGLEFLKVTDVQPAGVLTVAQERDSIFKYLQGMKRRQVLDDYSKKLMADNNVVMHLKPVTADQLSGAKPVSQSGNTNSAPSAAPH